MWKVWKEEKENKKIRMIQTGIIHKFEQSITYCVADAINWGILFWFRHILTGGEDFFSSGSYGFIIIYLI